MGNLLSLAEARAAIRLPASDTTRDDELTSIYIPAVSLAIEDITGPIIRRQFERPFDGGRQRIILLGHRNVSTVSVVENGITLTEGSDFLVDHPAGIVIRGTTIAPMPFFYGRLNINITWFAGDCVDESTVPANVKLAARTALADEWTSSQQGFRPNNGQPIDMVPTPSGYFISNRAFSMLRGLQQTSFFA